MTTEKTTISPKSTSTILNPSYVMKKIQVDKDTIKLFDIDDENRRMIRTGKAKELSKQLNEQIHFSSPFVVNEKDEKYFLIDGNHRHEAIKLKLGTDKNFKITIWVAVYKDLTKEEERNVFKLWNMGVSQTSTDFLKMYFKTIPCGQEMLRRLPTTIYGSDTTLNIKLIVGEYISAHKQNIYRGGYGAGKEETISDFSSVNSDDIDVIVEFAEFMREVFGQYDRKNNNLFYRTTPFSVFMRIWYDNRSMDKTKMVSIFKKVFAANVNGWKSFCDVGSRKMQEIMYATAMETLNKMQKREKFLSDKDIVPKKETERKILKLIEKKEKEKK